MKIKESKYKSNIVNVDVLFELSRWYDNMEDVYNTFDDVSEAEDLETQCCLESGWDAVYEFCYWIAKACGVTVNEVDIVDSKYGVLDESNDNYLTFEIEDCNMSDDEIEDAINILAGGRVESIKHTYELTDVNGSGKSCELNVEMEYRLGNVVDVYRN